MELITQTSKLICHSSGWGTDCPSQVIPRYWSVANTESDQTHKHFGWWYHVLGFSSTDRVYAVDVDARWKSCMCMYLYR